MLMKSAVGGKIFIVVMGSLFPIATLGCRSDSGTDAALNSGTIVRHQGVYARGSGTPDRYLSLDFIDGWNVQTGWSLLEPQQGQYVWSEIDNALEVAKALSQATGLPKRISVSIGGAGTPSWVYDFGSGGIYFIDKNPYHATVGDCLLTPIPWDPIYLSMRQIFIQAMGRHYTEERPDLLPYLSYLQGTSEAVTNGWGLSDTIYTNNTCTIPTSWDALGYSSEKIIDGFKQLGTALLGAFPNTPIWVGVGNISAQIDSIGPTYVAEQIADWGFAVFGTRFGVWREDINACILNPPASESYWHILYDHPGQNGAETAAAVTGDDGERMSGNCTITDGSIHPPPNGIRADDVLMKTINGALDYGMRYVEFNTTDIDNPDLISIFVYVHQEFTK